MKNMNIILNVIDSITKDKLVKSIINSVNPNQEKSKKWLVEKSKEYFDFYDNPKICIAAGWYGDLANKLKSFTKHKIISFDKDPITKKIGEKLYKDIWFQIKDIKNFNFECYDIIICTSCEHLNQKLIDKMIYKARNNTLIILQSNDYKSIKDHINCYNNVNEFKLTLNLKKIFYSGSIKLENCNRFMVIGLK